MRSEVFQLDVEGGVSLKTHCWLPDNDDDIRATLQISHGMAEHSARYARLAEAMTAKGYAVYANDHRGHGGSKHGVEGHPGDEDGFALMVRDQKKLADHVAAKHADKVRVLFGHSMGSLIAGHYLFHFPGDHDACALSGTLAPLDFVGRAGIRVAKLERLRHGKRGVSPLLEKMASSQSNAAFKPNRTTHDWLSRDTGEVDKYVNDPDCGFPVTTELWVEFLYAIKGFYDPKNLAKIDPETAIFVFSGDKDPVGREGKSVREFTAALRKVGLRRVQSKLYPDGRHEMLNEINREEVVEDILAWLDEVLEARFKSAA